MSPVEVDVHIKLRDDLTPSPFNGRVYAVYKRDCMTPERPLAVFGYGDWAEKWARETWGEWDGWRFRMPETIEVREILVFASEKVAEP